MSVQKLVISSIFIAFLGAIAFVAVFLPASAQCHIAQATSYLGLSGTLSQETPPVTPREHSRIEKGGVTVTIALPENAADKVWNEQLLAQFEQATGIQVITIRPGNDTTAVLRTYLSDLGSNSRHADVYAIDIVWPGILSKYAEDLRPAFGRLDGMAPQLVENDTVDGELVAVPYFAEFSLLYYRPDLLVKYHFQHPPRTWAELQHQAEVIQAGERAAGRSDFWGYLWQGAPSEALTCNALEWQISEGGGSLIDSQRAVNFSSGITARTWDRARRWIGTISPPQVTEQLEDDSLRIWKDGDAAFMRNWPYAYTESMRPDSPVRSRVGITSLPRGDSPGAQHADVLGGFELMVSNRSRHKQAAIELVRFLTSSRVQRFNAIKRGYAPTWSALYADPGIAHANPMFASLRQLLADGAVIRPSTIAGSAYAEVSSAYFNAVHQALNGEQVPSEAIADLKIRLQKILGTGKRL